MRRLWGQTAAALGIALAFAGCGKEAPTMPVDDGPSPVTEQPAAEPTKLVYDPSVNPRMVDSLVAPPRRANPVVCVALIGMGCPEPFSLYLDASFTRALRHGSIDSLGAANRVHPEDFTAITGGGPFRMHVDSALTHWNFYLSPAPGYLYTLRHFENVARALQERDPDLIDTVLVREHGDLSWSAFSGEGTVVWW